MTDGVPKKMSVDVRVGPWRIENQCIGKTAKITVLQTEWEMMTGANFPRRQYNAPQKAPATAAAPMSMKLKDQICTPA